MRRFSVVVLALALALTAGAPGEAQQRNLTWTAGQVGGGWYAQAGGFVELIKGKDQSFNI
ncbi:MAG: TRAP transporter substrate-binding protein, partial [Candidatus Rokuibacteriota bacterium]